jgi:hypothetical protein
MTTWLSVTSHLSEDTITTAHPWEVSCGALDKQFIVLFSTDAVSIIRRLFLITYNGLQAVQPFPGNQNLMS